MKRLLLLIALALWILGPVAGQGGRVLFDFADPGQAGRWGSEAPAKLSVEAAPEGQGNALRADLPPGDYPGLSTNALPADWSAAQALSFRVRVQQPARLGIRIDDAKSTNYDTRFNRDEIPLQAGWNDLAIPLKDVARKIDLTQVRLLVLFLHEVKEPTTLWLADVALAAMPDKLIAGFEQDADAALVASEQSAVRTLSADQASQGERSLRIALPAGDYPGVQIQVPPDWRSYEALRFDIWCERPSNMAIRIDDASSAGYATRYNEEAGVLRQGWNHVQVPLDRVRQVLDLSRVKLLIPFLLEVPKPITIYLDNVHLGALREDYDDRPLPGELGVKKEFAYSMAVETPHVKWARPLAGGPVRALLVTGVDTGRETIELAQRIHLDFDVVTIERSWDVNRWGMGDHYGARGDQDDFRLIYRYLEQALTSEKRYDVIVLPMVHGWNMLTKRSRDALLRRVQEGAGLVLARPFVGKDGQDRRLWELSPLVDGPDDYFQGAGYVVSPPEAFRSGQWTPAAPHFITDGLPLELLPFDRLGHAPYKAAGEVILKAGDDPLAAVREYGKGRVVAFAYRNRDITPEVGGDGRSEPPYPYQEVLYRLVSRAILWAARRDAAPRLKVTPESLVLAWGDAPPKLKLVCVLSGLSKPIVEAHVRSVAGYGGAPRVGQRMQFPQAHGTIQAEWSLPRGTVLNAGPTAIDFILRSSAGVHEFRTVLLKVQAPATLASLEAPAGPVAEGATVPAAVGLAGTAPAGSRVLFEALDGNGRVLSRASVPAASARVAATLACRGVVSPWVAVEARLMAGTRLLDRKRSAMVPVTRRQRQPDDDFHAFLSGVGYGGHPYLRRAYQQRFRDMGAEVGSVFGGDVPNSLNVHGMGVYAYERAGYNARLKQYEQTHDKFQFLSREPCLNDPAWRKETHDRVVEAARHAAPFKPFSYYVSDESSVTSYTDAADLCFSPHCLREMRTWLQGICGSLDRLNSKWATRFASWDEVVPDTADEARKRGSFCSWADHRTFMERTFAGAFRFIRDSAREVDPQAEIKISGTQATVAHNGCDWYALTQVIKETGPYTTGDQWELHRSFMRGGRTGGWTGYGSSGDGVRHFIWKGLLHRVSYMNIFWQYSCLNPDFGFSKSARDMAVAFKELSGGMGLLINRLQRDNSGIAVHYSLPSVHAAWITGRQGDLDATRHALTVLLEDLGLQYDFVASPQLEAGELLAPGDASTTQPPNHRTTSPLRPRFRCLILPFSVALSDREAAAISAFAAKGGRVLRAGPAGEMDEHCGKRAALALADVPALPGLADYEKGRDAAAGKAMRQAARRLLAQVKPEVTLSSAGGEVVHCERVLFREGSVQVLALLRDDLGGRRVVGPDGVEYREVVSGAAAGPQEVEIRLPKPAWVTDVRARKALGRTDRVAATIRSAEAKLFSLLAYPVRALKLSAKGASVEIALSAVGATPGMHVVHLDVLRPDGKPEPLYTRNVVVERGRARVEIPFAASDPAGVWVVAARDVATGTRGTCSLKR